MMNTRNLVQPQTVRKALHNHTETLPKKNKKTESDFQSDLDRAEVAAYLNGAANPAESKSVFSNLLDSTYSAQDVSSGGNQATLSPEELLSSMGKNSSQLNSKALNLQDGNESLDTGKLAGSGMSQSGGDALALMNGWRDLQNDRRLAELQSNQASQIGQLGSQKFGFPSQFQSNLDPNLKQDQLNRMLQSSLTQKPNVKLGQLDLPNQIREMNPGGGSTLELNDLDEAQGLEPAFQGDPSRIGLQGDGSRSSQFATSQVQNISQAKAMIPQKGMNLKSIQAKNPRIEMSGGDYLSTLNSIQNAGRLSEDKSQTSGTSQLGSEQLDLKGVEKGLKLSLEKVNPADDRFNQGTQMADAAKAGLLNSANGVESFNAKPTTELTAQVVPGAMAKERFTTDSLVNIGNGVRNLSLQGGGSIRVRLKPENLGELNIRVMTEGGRVGLQIQAQSERAKAIIEQNISHLKESLSAQHLTLGQVDFTVGTSNSFDQQKNENSGQSAFQNFSNFQENFGQSAHQNSHHEGFNRGYGSEMDSDLSRVGRPQPMRVATGTAAVDSSNRGGYASGRLDVRA